MSKQIKILVPETPLELVESFERFLKSLETIGNLIKEIEAGLSVFHNPYAIGATHEIRLGDIYITLLHGKTKLRLVCPEEGKTYAECKAWVKLRDASYISEIFAHLKDPQNIQDIHRALTSFK